uniref:hypothetical protein n=1 Tax=Roseovarius indicus TaxID=540747 RepID=UPI003B518653
MGAAVMRAALCALMVLVTGPAPAETYKIENIGSGDPRGATDGLSFTYDVHLRLELLLGEPVVGTRFRWQLNPNFSEVEVSELVTDERRRVKLLNLPREAQLKARIYDVDIEFEMSGATGVYYLLADGGDPGPGDGETWSFNVPGSPDWSEMFYRTPLDGPDDRADYVSEKEAKRIWKEGLRLHTARLVDVKVSTHDLVRWYVQQSKAPEVAVTQKAIRNLAEGIREGFGYDLDADEFAEVTPEDRWDTEGMSGLPEEEGLRSSEIDYQILSERLGKLLAMPKKFEPTGELILFDAAVAELRSDIAALAEQRTERGLKDYPLKLGLSPREFEEGHDIEVQPQYRLVSMRTGETLKRVAPLYDQYFFDFHGENVAVFDDLGQVTPFVRQEQIRLLFGPYVAVQSCIYDLTSGEIVNHCNKHQERVFPNIRLDKIVYEAAKIDDEGFFDVSFNERTRTLKIWLEYEDRISNWAAIETEDRPRLFHIWCETGEFSFAQEVTGLDVSQGLDGLEWDDLEPISKRAFGGRKEQAWLFASVGTYCGFYDN